MSESNSAVADVVPVPEVDGKVDGVADAPKRRGRKKKVEGGVPAPRSKRAWKPKEAKEKAAPKKELKKDQAVDLVAEEAALMEKYGKRPYNQEIMKGSLEDIGSKGEYAGKRTVEIKCQRCAGDGKETLRRIATSDLHQVKNCGACVRELRLERRKKMRKTAAKARKK